MKTILEPETKIEILIKLAFGIPITSLAEEYGVSIEKITNFKKNNYIIYNQFLEHWKIENEVAKLGLTPKNERALNVVKKFYKNKIKIISEEEIYLEDNFIDFPKILKLADQILKKDNINNFLDYPYLLKNNYQ